MTLWNILFASRELPVLLILGVEFPWLAAFHYNIGILKYFCRISILWEAAMNSLWGKTYSHGGQMKIISYYFSGSPSIL